MTLQSALHRGEALIKEVERLGGGTGNLVKELFVNIEPSDVVSLVRAASPEVMKRAEFSATLLKNQTIGVGSGKEVPAEKKMFFSELFERGKREIGIEGKSVGLDFDTIINAKFNKAGFAPPTPNERTIQQSEYDREINVEKTGGSLYPLIDNKTGVVLSSLNTPEGTVRFAIELQQWTDSGAKSYIPKSIETRNPATVLLPFDSTEYLNRAYTIYRAAGGYSDKKDDKLDGYDKAVFFWSIITGLNETISPSWTDEFYFGRTDPIYRYESTKRQVSIDFTLVTLTPAELGRNIRKLEFLTRCTYPSEMNNGRQPPIIKFTLGDLYRKQLGVVTSLTFDFLQDGQPWHNHNNVQLPIAIGVSISFDLFHEGQPSFDGIGRERTSFFAYVNDLNNS